VTDLRFRTVERFLSSGGQAFRFPMENGHALFPNTAAPSRRRSARCLRVPEATALRGNLCSL
jgi:hypothetical protein